MFYYTHNGSDHSHELRIVTDNVGKFMDLLEICQSMIEDDEPDEEYKAPWEEDEEEKKPKFRLEDYPDDKYVMHCGTEREARIFCDFLDANGRHWHGGDSYKDDTEWSEYKEDTIYRFNEGFFGCGAFPESEDVLLEFTDFDWSDYESEVK